MSKEDRSTLDKVSDALANLSDFIGIGARVVRDAKQLVNKETCSKFLAEAEERAVSSRTVAADKPALEKK